MASMWRKAMLYLGLGPDDEYDDYDQYDEPAPAPLRPSAPPQQAAMPPNRYPVAQVPEPAYEREPEMGSRSVRTIGPTTAVRPQPSGDGGDPSARPHTAVVRPLQPVASAKPHVVAPTSFNQAQEVADKLKNTQPVIVNLQNVDRDLSRRIIDFASGLCYGLGGQMERVANQVFLLTPSNVEVSAEDRRRLHEHGYPEG
ncbi:MAG: cell division protein SepF [Actinomycetota bacterium]|nr:cell division protein SepF [Actinomycetota bacterium]